MFAHIERWRSSSLTQKEYCRKARINHSDFYYWLTRFKEQINCEPQPACFIPVSVQVPEETMLDRIIVTSPNGMDSFSLLAAIHRPDSTTCKRLSVLHLDASTKYFWINSPASFRKEFDGRCGLVKEHLRSDVTDDGIFIFMNRRRNAIKLLKWEGDELAIYHKRIEQGPFDESKKSADGKQFVNSGDVDPQFVLVDLVNIKIFLFILFILLNCIAMAQTSSKPIGNPVKIGKLDVAQFDFPKKMNWHDAKKACVELGKGWSLPTKDQLGFLYQNQDKIGGFSSSYYWSSTETSDEHAWRHNFSVGMSGFIADKENEYFVRAVKVF